MEALPRPHVLPLPYELAVKRESIDSVSSHRIAIFAPQEDIKEEGGGKRGSASASSYHHYRVCVSKISCDSLFPEGEKVEVPPFNEPLNSSLPLL